MVARRLLAIGVVLAGCLQSCPDPRDWDPQGAVTWLQWRETDAAGGRTAQGTFAVANTGRVAMAAVDMAIVVQTNTERYYLQSHTELALPPGKTAFGTVELPYRSPDEHTALDGLRVESVSFH